MMKAAEVEGGGRERGRGGRERGGSGSGRGVEGEELGTGSELNLLSAL